jgi:sugar phosphate isomerase/epimerase
MRPISSATRIRIADYLQRTTGASPADAVVKATKILDFMEACGVDVVMPGWVPVIDDARPGPKPFRWEDLADNLSEMEDREPWKPYNA